MASIDGKGEMTDYIKKLEDYSMHGTIRVCIRAANKGTQVEFFPQYADSIDQSPLRFDVRSSKDLNETAKECVRIAEAFKDGQKVEELGGHKSASVKNPNFPSRRYLFRV